jgi:transposase
MSEREMRVSQRELHRLHVVRLTLEGRESVGKGAKLLGISARQMKRLRRKIKERGAEGLLHGNRGKGTWNKTASQRMQKVIALARGRYRGLNDTHLTEKLKEKEKIEVSRATVRRVLREAGLLRSGSAVSSATISAASAKPRRDLCCCGTGVLTAGLERSSASGV